MAGRESGRPGGLMGGGAYGPDHSIRTGNPISRAIGYKDKALGPDFTSKYGAGWYGMVGPDMDAMGSSANGVPGAAPMPGVQAMGSFDKSREGMKTNRPGQPIGYAGLSPAGEDASPISAALGSPYSRATPAAVGLMGFGNREGYGDPIGAAMGAGVSLGGPPGGPGGGSPGGRSGPVGGPAGAGRSGPAISGPSRSGPSSGPMGSGARSGPAVSGPSRSGPSSGASSGSRGPAVSGPSRGGPSSGPSSSGPQGGPSGFSGGATGGFSGGGRRGF